MLLRVNRYVCIFFELNVIGLTLSSQAVQFVRNHRDSLVLLLKGEIDQVSLPQDELHVVIAMCTYALQVVPRTELVGHSVAMFQRMLAYASPFISCPVVDSAGCIRLPETLLSRPLTTKSGGKICYKIPKHCGRDGSASSCLYRVSVLCLPFIYTCTLFECHLPLPSATGVLKIF